MEVAVACKDEEMPDDLPHDPIRPCSKPNPCPARIGSQCRLCQHREQVGIGMYEVEDHGASPIVGRDRRAQIAPPLLRAGACATHRGEGSDVPGRTRHTLEAPDEVRRADWAPFQ